jgi:triosephosphate isomerase (TIM)
MRERLVAANWKMHGSRADNARLIETLAAQFPADAGPCVICPPHVYLGEVVRLLRAAELPVALGAQDVSAEHQGAYTGDVSAAMLRDVGASHVIVGHSERRRLHGEDDALVARKFAAARTAALVPVLCVGEDLAEREAGRTFEVVGRQLDAVLGGSGVGGFERAIIAYEPCWAIGTGRNARPGEAQEVHAFIRGRIAQRDAKIAASVQILYGGSLKPANAAELFAMPDVDGGLVGGASLVAEQFLAIMAAARR